MHAGYVHAYATSLQTVFLVAVPIAAAAFALTWLLREVPLRKTTAATNPADTYAPTAMPASRSSLDELARSLSVLARRENRAGAYTRLAARADLDLDPRSTRTLLRLAEPGRPRAGTPEAAGQLIARGLASRGQRPSGRAGDDAAIGLTLAGTATATRLQLARQQALAELLTGWSPEQHADIQAMVASLARDLRATAPP